MKAKRYDHLERRCPRLGGAVDFHYCRTSGREKACCWKVIDCWWEYFDVTAHLKENLSNIQFEALVAARPEPKIASLVDLIRRAKANTGKNET